MSPRHDEESLAEPLVLPLGTRGYLRFPDAFKEQFPFEAATLPEPIASLDRKGGSVRLTYTWTKAQMEEAAAAVAAKKAQRKTKQQTI